MSFYNTPDSSPESPYPGGVVDMKASARIPEDEINMAPVQYTNCRGYTMGLRYGLGTLLHTMREMYKGELLVLGNPRIRPWDICILRDEYNDMVGPVEVEAVVHMFSHETGYLTEIKPNAVVMANEISSMPVLNALQLMCMAVQDNANGKASIDTELSYSESDAFSAAAVTLTQHRPPKLEPTKAWKQDMVAEYKSVFGEDGFSLEEMFPNWSDTEMQRITRGIQDPKELKDSLTSGIGLAGLGVGIASGATAFLASKGYYPKNKWGAIAALALLGTSTGAALGLNGVINSVNLSWFIAAPILFAKCMEEETVTIMPLTKNGIPIVSGLTARDPSMLWRSIFNKYYNYAQDTAIGLQDMAWFWNMAGDSWWDKWVEYNEGYVDYRRDFAEAAGGG